jgi:predicted ATP-grasp superfamily ATP-dependent carboligase
VNLLITSSRMPFALDEIRKFGRRGHRVFAADTIRSAPGSHSRWVGGRVRLPPPQYQPLRFVEEVRRLVRERAIDLIVPCFEEVFYLARHRDGLPLFAPEFPLLAQLHNKTSFNALARSLGIAAPRSLTATDDKSLAEAASAFARFVARPVWSRGGVDLCTNAGPLAFAIALADCAPTPEQPWIVQEYADGVDLCTFSVAREGRVVAHCTYRHPLEIEHGGGIVFESVDDPETLAVVQAIVGATGYHGQIGMDFRRDGDKLVVLECNPRPTAGAHLASDDLVVDAVLAPPNDVRVVPAGVRKKYVSAIVRDMLVHLGHARQDAHYLFDHSGDLYGESGDRLPALYQVLSYAHVLWYRTRHRRPARPGTALVAAYFDGIQWNGDAIP